MLCSPCAIRWPGLIQWTVAAENGSRMQGTNLRPKFAAENGKEHKWQERQGTEIG
jgi:hypothetical protein